ncbi:MAG: MFS transporter [Reichenbachiella sp.]
MQQIKIDNIIILFSLWLLMFSASSQFFIIAPILSQIGDQLHIPQALRGTLITAYAITVGIIALLTGPISDRVGRRKVLLFGTATMAISLLMHQLAVDFYSILLLRIFSGFAGGILTGSCVAYIGDHFESNKRGWANGLVATGSAAGQILGIPAGTILSSSLGFHAPFQFFGIVMAAAFVLIFFKLPQPNVKLSTCKLNLKATVLNYGAILQIPKVKTIALGYLLMFLSFTTFVVYFPSWLENSFHLGHYEIASLFLVGGLATVVSGPFSGRLSDKFGRKQIIIYANLLLVIIMPISVMMMQHLTQSYYVIFFIIMVLMVGRMVPFQALASEIVDDHERGRVMSLTISIGQLGMALGSAIAGFIYTEIDFIGNATLAAIASIAMAGIIQIFVPDHFVALQKEVQN